MAFIALLGAASLVLLLRVSKSKIDIPPIDLVGYADINAIGGCTSLKEVYLSLCTSLTSEQEHY